jgi:AP2 domain/HNH endonuclease
MAVRRPVTIDGDIARISLTKGYEAVIDSSCIGVVSGWRWSVKITPWNTYARGRRVVDGKVENVLMHRLLISEAGKETDHKDCNGLNNKLSNLRVATSAQNQFNQRLRKDNKSGVKGVYWCKRGKRWRAQIRVNGKHIYLGSYTDKNDAAAAYAKASAEMHGEFGRLV